MAELFGLLFTSLIINNVILTQFLGMCPFMGVSKKRSSALGMGVAVVFVIVVAAIVTYGLYYLVLVPLGLEFMDLITFILVIASLVQLTEMFIKKKSPALYKSLGVYLPLITTNCVVLNVCLVNIQNLYDFPHMLMYSIGTPLGFALVLYIFSTIRERLELSDVPEFFKGNPIALGILFVGALIAIYIWAYLNNKKTPLPKGCENLKADCDGCKLVSCSLHPDHGKKKEEI